MLRFSANIGFLWPDRPLLARIEAAGDAGFAAIELHWPYDMPADVVRDACARRGLVVLGINTPFGDKAAGEFGLAALPGREADFAASFDRALSYADAIGASAIHVLAGLVAPADRDAATRTLIANLTIAAEKAGGRTLLLEPISQRARPGYLYSHLDEAVAVMDAVGAGNIRLMFDAHHVGVTEGQVIARLRRYRDRIGHVQIAAVPSRAEPDEGAFDFPAFFHALEDMGYAGWVGCEYKPRGDTDAGLAWMKRLSVTPNGWIAA